MRGAPFIIAVSFPEIIYHSSVVGQPVQCSAKPKLITQNRMQVSQSFSPLEDRIQLDRTFSGSHDVDK